MVSKHTAANVRVSAKNVRDSNDDSKQCPKCKKEFARRIYMLNHSETCNGLHKLQCEHCLKMLACRSSKSEHLRCCKVKLEKDSCAVVPFPSAPTAGTTSTLITGDHNTVNNTTNNNNNNTTNNNNNTMNINQPNIIVFGSEIKFVDDHISKQMLTKLLKNKDFEGMLSLYSHELLKRKENQCVQKTNLRSAISKVHVGNNVWESRLDQHIYPDLMTSIAFNFSGSMDKYKIAMQKALDTYIEDVTCNGEHGNSDAKEQIKRMQASYKNLIGTVKLILFDLTKQAMATTKAQAICDVDCI